VWSWRRSRAGTRVTPPPHRAPADLVAIFLEERFPDPPLTLPASQYLDVLRRVVEARLPGGAVYDALIGATVKHAGATLLTRDARARVAYERIGVRHDLV